MPRAERTSSRPPFRLRRLDAGLLAFFALAFAISWSALGLLQIVASAAGLGSWQVLTRAAETTFTLDALTAELLVPAWTVRLLTIVADFGPSLAALVVATATGRLRTLLGRLTRWRVAPGWYAIAFGLPAAVMTTAIGLYLVTGGTLAPPLLGPTMLAALLGWWALRTVAGGGLGEELGWRGYALARLQGRMTPFAASVWIGIVWALWHLPLVLVSSNPGVQAAVLALFIAPMAFLYTWVFNGTGGSVLLVVLLHGSQNGVSAFLERSFLPSLADADLWVVFRILILLVVAGAAAVAVVRQGRAGTVVRDAS